MLEITLLTISVLIVLFIIIKKSTSKKRKNTTTTKEDIAPQESITTSNKEKDIVQVKDEIVEKEPIESKKDKPKELPKCKYPPFTHGRLIEMGLSDEEAKEFVQELIPQLQQQIPLIVEEYKKKNFHQMERLTHSIKGSATNLGTGGVSDLLVECNTYLKTGTDIEIAKVYLEYLVHYTKELKKQYE